MKSDKLILLLFIFLISVLRVTAQQTCLNEEGIVCDGFCYTPSLENYQCVDSEFVESEQQINLEQRVIVTINSPKSIPINSDFDVEVTFRVPESYPFGVEFTFSKVIFDYLPGSLSPQNYHQQVEVNKKFSMNAGDEESVKVSLKTADYKTLTGKVLLQIFGVTAKSFQVNVYEPQQPTSVCGERMYNMGDAICKNEVLYPLGIHTTPSCSSNIDCTEEGTSCFQNSCIKRDPKVFDSKTYNIPVVTLFLDDQLTDSEKKNIIDETKDSVDRANGFFVNEKNAWGNQSELNLKLYSQECPSYGREDFLADVEDSSDAIELSEKIAKSCNLEGYPIVYYFVKDNNDQEVMTSTNKFNLPASTGLNFGPYAFLGRPSKLESYQTQSILFPVLVHETLHSFGEFDIYHYAGEPGGFYQWNGCSLFTAKWETFDKNPKLCSLEAFILGFTEDESSKRIESVSESSKTSLENISSNDLITDNKSSINSEVSEDVSPNKTLIVIMGLILAILITVTITLLLKKNRRKNDMTSWENFQN